MIPDGWQVSTISELAEVDPEALSSATDLSEEIDYISLEDVSRGRLLASTRLAFAEAPSRARRVIREGDVLFGTVRPNLQSHLYFEGGFRRPVASTGFAVVRTTRENDPRFIYFSLMSDRTQTQVDRIIAGSNYPAVSSRDVRALSVLAPPPREQRAIAEALSDADALVESLDALIAKKRDMKQAAMQQLLTGRTRLPGFLGEWKTTQLGEVLDFEVGYPFDSGQFHQYDGLRLVRNADLKSDAAVVCIRGSYPPNYLVTNGDLLVGMDGDFVPVLWKGGEALLNQRVGRVKTTSRSHASYMSFALLGPLKDIEHMTSATTVKHLSHSDVVGIRIPLPSVQEQKAIAEALSDMDAEIDALVGRREKAELVKQGMMQELLSGRVRLV